MSFFCSDHHLFIAGAPRVITCPRCGGYSYEAAPAGSNGPGARCPACTLREATAASHGCREETPLQRPPGDHPV